MPGAHNAANATAAAALALRAGVTPDSIARGLVSFPGIARRFDIRHDAPGLTVIDDYAHHPSEIDNTIAAARAATSWPAARRGLPTPPLHPHPRLPRRVRHRPLQTGPRSAPPNLCGKGIAPPGVDAQAVGEKMVGCPVECPAESRFWMFWRCVIRTCCSSWERGTSTLVVPPAIERLSASHPPETPQTP